MHIPGQKRPQSSHQVLQAPSLLRWTFQRSKVKQRSVCNIKTCTGPAEGYLRTGDVGFCTTLAWLQHHARYVTQCNEKGRGWVGAQAAITAACLSLAVLQALPCPPHSADWQPWYSRVLPQHTQFLLQPRNSSCFTTPPFSNGPTTCSSLIHSMSLCDVSRTSIFRRVRKIAVSRH